MAAVARGPMPRDAAAGVGFSAEASHAPDFRIFERPERRGQSIGQVPHRTTQATNPEAFPQPWWRFGRPM